MLTDGMGRVGQTPKMGRQGFPTANPPLCNEYTDPIVSPVAANHH